MASEFKVGMVISGWSSNRNFMYVPWKIQVVHISEDRSMLLAVRLPNGRSSSDLTKAYELAIINDPRFGEKAVRRHNDSFHRWVDVWRADKASATEDVVCSDWHNEDEAIRNAAVARRVAKAAKTRSIKKRLEKIMSSIQSKEAFCRLFATLYRKYDSTKETLFNTYMSFDRTVVCNVVKTHCLGYVGSAVFQNPSNLNERVEILINQNGLHYMSGVSNINVSLDEIESIIKDNENA